MCTSEYSFKLPIPSISLAQRLDILEALEDAVGDFNDMGMGDDILNAHRDFNE